MKDPYQIEKDDNRLIAEESVLRRFVSDRRWERMQAFSTSAAATSPLRWRTFTSPTTPVPCFARVTRLVCRTCTLSRTATATA